MKTSSQNKVQIASVLGMIALLTLAALAPVFGGFIQQQHRIIRQNKPRRGKTEWLPVDLVFNETEAAACLISNKSALEIGNLRYDIISADIIRPPFLLQKRKIVQIRRSGFMEPWAGVLAGFEWLVLPPPKGVLSQNFSAV